MKTQLRKTKNSLVQKVVLEYAKLGIEEWNGANSDVKRRARAFLGYDIAEEEWNIAAMFKGADGSFIPMPRGPEQGQLEWSFFWFTGAWFDDTPRITFNLYILVREAKEGLAFRFEPQGLGTHNYGHFQFSVKIGPQTAKTLTPGWLPDSYPAFPCGVSDPMGLFLYMATSIHGYKGGFEEILADMLKKNFISPSQYGWCSKELNRLLGLTPETDLQ